MHVTQRPPKSMQNRWIVKAGALALFAGVVVGCNEEDEEEPVKTASIAATQAPVQTAAPVVVAAATNATPVVTGTPFPFPEPSAKPKSTGGGASANVAKCCAALRANAKSAPPEQQAWYNSAAANCDSMKSNPAAAAQIQTMARAGGYPAACG
jgi:hypothetical protein